MLAALLPLVILFVCYRLDVPLGRPGAPGAVGTLTYPYSPFVSERLNAAAAVLPVAAVFALGVWLLTSENAGRRRGGAVLAGVGFVGGAVWTFFAPPQRVSQHVFNFQSPSHDGAFVLEALHEVKDVRRYLAEFPQRARTPPERMRGTRVISNPPLTTLLGVAARAAVENSPAAKDALRALAGERIDEPTLELVTLTPLAAACLLTFLWLLAAPFLHALAKLFLPTPAAVAVAAGCFFSPLTILFSPGKDPAQLLTAALLLWLWFLGWRRGSAIACFFSGAALVGACMMSLVHVWIAAIAWTASLLATRRAGALKTFFLRRSLPAAGGAVLAALLLYAGLGWNVFATAAAVAQSQAAVTRGPTAMPLLWQTLGVPLFLLFAGPALWCAAMWLFSPEARVRTRPDPAQPGREARFPENKNEIRGEIRGGDELARFGLDLLLGSLAVMVATVGFTNMETPRLWIPFTPLLFLGMALQLTAFRRPAGQAALLLAALVFAQVAVSALQWSLMDMREAEMRLSTGRLFK